MWNLNNIISPLDKHTTQMLHAELTGLGSTSSWCNKSLLLSLLGMLWIVGAVDCPLAFPFECGLPLATPLPLLTAATTNRHMRICSQENVYAIQFIVENQNYMYMVY